MPMLEEFHQVLRTPKHSTAYTLGKTQDLVLSAFEQIFPQTFDLQSLHTIYQEVLGPKAIPVSGEIEVTIQEQATLNYKLVQHFICLIELNFVNIDVYRDLEEQTQRAQSTIRSHIKIQQEMKMYLEYLESKIDKMHKQLHGSIQSPEYLKRQIQIMLNRESLLQKQKINLMKRNEKLERQIQILTNQIQTLLSPKDSNEKSIGESRKFMQEINTATHKNQDDGSSEINCTHVKETNKLSARSAYDRESLRHSANDYDLTQKKKTVYFPSKN